MDCERKEPRMTARLLANRIRRMAMPFAEIVETAGRAGLRMKTRNLF